MTFVRANPGGWTDGTDGPTPKQLHHMQVNVSRALDGEGGGSYTPIGPINISDNAGAGGALGNVDVHGLMLFSSVARVALKPGSLPNTDNQTLGIASGGQILRFVPSAAVRQHQMDNAGATPGDWIIFISTAGSGNTLSLYKAGAAPGYAAGDLIVQCAAGAHVCALLYFDGTDWRLGEHSPAALAGASA